MLPPDTIIGIDLGTTNSCAAVVVGDGQVKLVPVQGGDAVIPSIWAIDDKGNELVGHEARRQWQLNPRNTLYATKRLMGRSPRDGVVERVQRSVQYRVLPGDRDDVVVECRGRRYRIPEVGSRILARVRRVASEFVGFDARRAVVTVPAYFTDRQRQAVKEAGALVGLEVVRIINEPTAAALAFGLGRGLRERVLVFDLGGGTFDVSIIDIRDRVFEVKATGGDVFLGGLDVDDAVTRHVLEEFRRSHGIDLSTDPVAMQRIKDVAERAKIDLSARAEATLAIPFVAMTPQGKPINLEMKLGRPLLEKLAQPVLDRTLQIVGRVLADAGVSAGEIDEVLLVGGQSRMPAVQERLTRFFGKAPSKGVHPDEAVAVGAALYAWSLRKDSDLKLQLLDVIPMAIGLEQAGGAMHVVFPRNAPIPNARAISATTSLDGQTELAVRIFQGDHPQVARDDLLGEFTFSGVRPAPAGQAQVEIVFEVGIEGILTLSARDPRTGRQMRTTVRVAQD